MKYILYIILLLFYSGSCIAQADSTHSKITIEQLYSGMNYMKMNLDKAHKEFSTGAALSGLGVGLIGISMLLPDETSETASGEIKKENSLKDPLIIGGSIIAVVGSVFMIDSHKYIGKAGRWKFDGNKIVMDF